MPEDFDDKRSEYYVALNKSQDKYEFTADLKQQMKEAMEMLNSNIPTNIKVKMQQTKKKKKKSKKGWICLSPLKPQPAPQNIGDLKEEILEHWAATNLLDILKETEFQVDFTSCFKTRASKEIFDRDTIQERLLLRLFGVATNIGIKRIRSGNHKISYSDLRYIYRRFITSENTREAIVKIVNAVFQARDPSVWGEATSTCISDAKQFSAWDQNLMTEWHARYRGAGIMVYWHVDKNFACIYSHDSEIILRRFTRNNAKHPVYKALMELGKAIKTIFLCKYLSSEALRQEIHEGLNVVERWNSVNGFISYAKKGVISTNRPKDQEISLLCLHLLQISMVYINTIMIQQILKQSRWRDRLTIEDKRALSPLIHLHINPYGIFNLDLTTRLQLEI